MNKDIFSISVNDTRSSEFFINNKRKVSLTDINKTYKRLKSYSQDTDYYQPRLDTFKKFCKCFEVTHTWRLCYNSNGYYCCIDNWLDFLKCTSKLTFKRSFGYQFEYPYPNSSLFDHMYLFYSNGFGEMFLAGMPYVQGKYNNYGQATIKQTKDLNDKGLDIVSLGKDLSFHYPKHTGLNILGSMEFVDWAKRKWGCFYE